MKHFMLTTSRIFIIAVYAKSCCCAANFDLKSKLVEHRSKFATHLQGQQAHNFFVQNDQRSIRILEQLIGTHTRRLQQHEDSLLAQQQHGQENGGKTNDILTEDQQSASVAAIEAASQQIQYLQNESKEEQTQRYRELHEAMMEMHLAGFEDLDFGRTGLS